jgi:hypothetical protein
MRRRSSVIPRAGLVLVAWSALGFGGYAMAGNNGIPAVKFIVVNKPATPTAKAVFVAKDPGIDKGTGTDLAGISASLQATYDNGSDPAVSGEWDAAQGSPNWITNKSTVGKYVNKLAPAGGATKVVVIKQNNLVKLVGKSTGDTPMDVLSTSSAPGGVATTAFCFDNAGTQNCYCSQFNACVWKSIAAGSGAKLVCKGGTADATCSASSGTTSTSTTVTTSGVSVASPECDGACPAGSLCADPGGGCTCLGLPTPCSLQSTTCVGECGGAGQACIHDGGGCICAP